MPQRFGNYLTDSLLVDVPRYEVFKGCAMTEKLLVLLIAAIPMLMPNLASAISIDVPGICPVNLLWQCPWN